MMEPKQVKFCVYADNDNEIRELQEALFDFVYGYYREGVLVSAPKLIGALRKFRNNPIIRNFLTQ